ncbi:EcsC family protein [Blautia producta]|uniref:EcsC family protein n=1 Tax=Blautia producta TaxID=33035 RepID=UPI0031B60040
MIGRRKKSTLTAEMETVLKKEQAFLKRNEEKKGSFLDRTLEEKVPARLQETLDKAFEKAFGLIFEKGTDVIEKTYSREKIEHTYKVDAYAAGLLENKKTLRAFKKKAEAAGNKNLLLAGVEGVGLGILGIGLPDIPLFTGMILKSIYETALHYGFPYDTEEEKYFILLLIQAALSYGEKLEEINARADRFIMEQTLPHGYDSREQIKETSAVLSGELLYMKFLQGIPVAGVIGGAYDSVYLKRILDYAKLKYRKRFLMYKDKAD